MNHRLSFAFKCLQSNLVAPLRDTHRQKFQSPWKAQNKSVSYGAMLIVRAGLWIPNRILLVNFCHSFSQISSLCWDGYGESDGCVGVGGMLICAPIVSQRHCTFIEQLSPDTLGYFHSYLTYNLYLWSFEKLRRVMNKEPSRFQSANRAIYKAKARLFGAVRGVRWGDRWETIYLSGLDTLRNSWQSGHIVPDVMGLLPTYLPNLVTNVPTIKEPMRPPIANTETVSEYMSVRASSFSPVPFRLTTVRL